MSAQDDVFKIRRRMAKTSFATILILIPVLIFIGLFGDSGQAPMMTAVMPILVIIVPALIANVAQYMQLVAAHDRAKLEGNPDERSGN
jgi:predicted aspartyl protease